MLITGYLGFRDWKVVKCSVFGVTVTDRRSAGWDRAEPLKRQNGLLYKNLRFEAAVFCFRINCFALDILLMFFTRGIVFSWNSYAYSTGFPTQHSGTFCITSCICSALPCVYERGGL
jgi:hypothetical protein